MLIIALVLALVGLAALVFAVVTSNELVAWICIGASVLGVVLLIVDALQERQRRQAGAAASAGPRRLDVGGTGTQGLDADYPEDVSDEGVEAASSPAAESGADDTPEAPTENERGSVSDDHNTR